MGQDAQGSQESHLAQPEGVRPSPMSKLGRGFPTLRVTEAATPGPSDARDLGPLAWNLSALLYEIPCLPALPIPPQTFLHPLLPPAPTTYACWAPATCQAQEQAQRSLQGTQSLPCRGHSSPKTVIHMSFSLACSHHCCSWGLHCCGHLPMWAVYSGCCPHSAPHGPSRAVVMAAGSFGGCL